LATATRGASENGLPLKEGHPALFQLSDGERPRNSRTTIVEVAKPIEAILQLIGPPPLLIRESAAVRPAAPLEVTLEFGTPARSAIPAPEPVIGIGLDLGDARVDLAARAFAFHIAAAVVSAEAEREAAIVQAKGLRAGGYGAEKNCGDGQANWKNTHFLKPR
jgi:hypothetical protein